MERTQKLLGIALAVLALDGCRGPDRVARPVGTGTPWHGSSAHGSSSRSYHMWSHYHHVGGAAAAAAAAHGGGHGGFGGAGAHGAGG